MKQFSSISESLNKSFKVYVTLELEIVAENSGEVGYKTDSIIGSIENLTQFNIENIVESKSIIK